MGDFTTSLSELASNIQDVFIDALELAEEHKVMIESVLEDIHTSVNNITESINTMNDKIQSQAAVTEGVTSTTDNIHDMSGRLLRLIENLS